MTAERVFKAMFPAVLALFASPIMSGLITLFTRGLTPALPAQWFEAWLVAFPTALFVVYVVSPVARRVTGALAGWLVAARGETC